MQCKDSEQIYISLDRETPKFPFKSTFLKIFVDFIKLWTHKNLVTLSLFTKVSNKFLRVHSFGLVRILIG